MVYPKKGRKPEPVQNPVPHIAGAALVAITSIIQSNHTPKNKFNEVEAIIARYRNALNLAQ